MKGALLVLALLVTRELSFHTAEGCLLFYEVFGTVAYGSKTQLDTVLDEAGATEAEKAAIGKIQDCYKELGWKAQLLDTVALLSITFSQNCLSESDPASFFKDLLTIIVNLPQIINLLES